MRKFFLAIIVMLFVEIAQANIIIKMQVVAGDSGKNLGTVTAEDTIYGLLLTPNLQGLPPGIHGFHIHEFPFCSDAGNAAGGHLDPLHTHQHHGPYRGDGHLGDLPVLIVNQNGKANLPVLAPRLKLDLIKGKSLMIHRGGDNYSDFPEKMGGGNMRLGCGVIEYF